MSLEPWDDFQNIIEDSVSELTKQELASAQRIDMFIHVFAKIICLIDQKILINLHFLNSENDMKFEPEYFPVNGILVYETNTDSVESAVESTSVKEVFPFEHKEFRHLRGIRGGEEIYLTRDCKLMGFSRSGGIWDALSTEETGDFYTLAAPTEYAALDLVKKYENFEQELLFNIKMAVVRAIKRDENNRSMLKGVIEHINTMDNKKQFGHDLEADLEQNPDDAETHAAYAWHLLRWGAYGGSSDFAGAYHHYQIAANLAPSNLEIQMRYGEFLTQVLWHQTVSGKTIIAPSEDIRNEGEQHLLAAIELAPDNVESHVLYARFLWWAGHKNEDLLAWGQDNPAEIEKIDAEYRKIFELNPDHFISLGNYLSYLFWAKRDYDAIISVGEHLVEHGMYDGYAQILRGMYQNWVHDTNLWKRWSPAQAEQWLNRAAELYAMIVKKRPDNCNDHLFYAEFLMWEKPDVNAAEIEIQKALACPLDSVNVHWNYGDLFLVGRQDRQGARREYEEAMNKTLQLDPRTRANPISGALLLRLASVDFLEGSLDAGLARIEEALSYPNPRVMEYPEPRVIELFFHYAYTKDPNAQNGALAELKTLIPWLRVRNSAFQFGGIPQNWFFLQLPWHVKQAIRYSHTNPKLLRALANVISRTAPITVLDKYPAWAAFD